MIKLLPIIDNVDYGRDARPPQASALADEVGERILAILRRAPTGAAAQCDWLAAIAAYTRYPLSTPRKARKSYDLSWIVEDDLDILDYLISLTIDTGANVTRCGIMLASIFWLLDRPCVSLTAYLKSKGLNITHGHFSAANYLQEIFDYGRKI